MTIDRRKFLKYGAGAGAVGLAGFAAPGLALGQIMPKGGPRVIVVGGGWGGATAAKYIRMQDPAIEVILIEPEPVFRSCPISNWVIGGLKTMADITMSYDALARRHGVKVIQDSVIAIEPDAKRVRTFGGDIEYDRLVVSPGISFIYDDIANLEFNTDIFPAAWKAGPETQQLRDELQAMEDGGTVVLSIPLGPFRCPPGPYERTSLIADYLKRNKPRSKIIVLDANQKIISKGKMFKAAWDDLYDGIIDYRPDNKVIGVDRDTRTLMTDFDEIRADVANVIPPQRANNLLGVSGLRPAGKRWAPVNPVTYESTVHADIHITGDSTDATTVGKVPKSGFIANSMGKVAAGAVVALMNGREPPRPSMANTCYSLVSAEEAISVTAVYDLDDATGKMAAIEGAKGLSPGRSRLTAQNAEDWATAIWSDMLG